MKDRTDDQYAAGRRQRVAAKKAWDTIRDGDKARQFVEEWHHHAELAVEKGRGSVFRIVRPGAGVSDTIIGEGPSQAAAWIDAATRLLATRLPMAEK